MFSWSTRKSARRRAALSALAVAVAGLAGCQAVADDAGSPEATETGATTSQTTTPTTTPTPTIDPDLSAYVALGDSYTAAPLFRANDKIKGCLRSATNYPARVAEKWHLDLVDVSCSGARTDNMLTPQHFSFGGQVQPPQFDALRPDTDLVTVGIGANDFRFFSRMIVDCIALAATDPTGSPCEQANQIAPAPQRIEDKLDVITAHVVTVTRGIKKRSPHARILMVGYPQLIPNAGECQGKLPLASGDYGFVRRLNLSLSDAVQQGALSSGAEYVDLIKASEGHDICSSKPWIAGVRGPQQKALGLHPYRREQRAVARLISAKL